MTQLAVPVTLAVYRRIGTKTVTTRRVVRVALGGIWAARSTALERMKGSNYVERNGGTALEHHASAVGTEFSEVW